MSHKDFENYSGKSTRRHARARRIDAMKMWENGTLDDRPIKERWSREFKKPKIKCLKNPLENFDEKNTFEGLVLEVHRRTSEIRLKDNSVIKAIYLATTSKELREFPAVGDSVLLGKSESGEYYIVRVLKRKSALKRPGPKDSHHRELTLAANVDQVVIVASVKDPEFNYGFVDRFLLAANLSDLPFLLVLTKVDLVETLPPAIEDFKNIVETVLPVSVVNQTGIEELKNILAGKISVFSGQSGVGKSSLINALIPHVSLKTGNVRERDGKGCHTTTSSSLLDLPGGGVVIDTPGIRELGLMNLDKATLAKIFPGFFQNDCFDCKYSDCLHQSEPCCGVRNRLEAGVLSKSRYESYLRILNARD